jgi:hypothetical protein
MRTLHYHIAPGINDTAEGLKNIAESPTRSARSHSDIAGASPTPLLVRKHELLPRRFNHRIRVVPQVIAMHAAWHCESVPLLESRFCRCDEEGLFHVYGEECPLLLGSNCWEVAALVAFLCPPETGLHAKETFVISPMSMNMRIHAHCCDTAHRLL